MVDIESKSEDVTDPLVKEIVEWMVLKEEQEGVVQVCIRECLVHFLALCAV